MNTMGTAVKPVDQIIILSPSWRHQSKSGIAQLTNSLAASHKHVQIYGANCLEADLDSLPTPLRFLPRKIRIGIAYNLYILKHRLSPAKVSFFYTSIEYMPLALFISKDDILFFQDFIQLFYPRSPFIWLMYVYGFFCMTFCPLMIEACSESSIDHLRRVISKARIKLYSHYLHGITTNCRILPPMQRSIDIFWLGTTAQHKNLNLLCEALQLLERKGLNLKVYVKIDINQSKRADQELVQRVSKVANILTASISSEDLRSYYKNTKLYLSTSLMEGYCLPIREAANCGALPLISDIPTFREIHHSYSRYHNLTAQDISEKVLSLIPLLSQDNTLSTRTSFLSVKAMEQELVQRDGHQISFGI